MDIPEIDFQLVEVACELYTLEDHLKLVEQHLNELQESESGKLAEELQQFEPDDPEGYALEQDFYHRHDLVYPRFFWGAFLISLYAVYESAVIETAGLIQKELGVEPSLANFGRGRRGSFLSYSEKYYKQVLHFELCPFPEAWERITLLLDVRNAFAHSNGRTEMVRDKLLERLQKSSKDGTGIEVGMSYVTVTAHFVKDTFECVQTALSDLIVRYKAWDSESQSN